MRKGVVTAPIWHTQCILQVIVRRIQFCVTMYTRKHDLLMAIPRMGLFRQCYKSCYPVIGRTCLSGLYFNTELTVQQHKRIWKRVNSKFITDKKRADLPALQVSKHCLWPYEYVWRKWLLQHQVVRVTYMVADSHLCLKPKSNTMVVVKGFASKAVL